MKLLTKELQKLYENAKICFLYFLYFLKDKKYRKVRDCCHYAEEDRCAAHKKFLIIIYMIIKLLITKFLWSNYDYHFTIKELVEKFKNIWLVQEKYKNWKIHKLCSSNRIKKLQEFKKTETKLKKKSLIYCNLLIVQGL